MRYYVALVHKDPESAFGISFPDLPSVFSAADDEEEIVPNAVDALRLLAEDEELPVPSSHAEILARADIRDELKEGGFLIRVPLIEDDTRTVETERRRNGDLFFKKSVYLEKYVAVLTEAVHGFRRAAHVHQHKHSAVLC